MKKIILVVSVLALLVSCKNSTNNEAPKEVIKKNISTEVEKVDKAVKQTQKVNISANQLETIISDFKSCKAASVKRADCRNTFTKFISQKYQLNEFKDKNGGYEIYDSIQPIVSKSNSWIKLGEATNQENINKAVEYTNNGGLAIIIDTSNTYGQVVAIQAGGIKKSGSWGLSLPNVFSLANHNPAKSFQGKSLAYAFKKSGDLKVYLRK